MHATAFSSSVWSLSLFQNMDSFVDLHADQSLTKAQVRIAERSTEGLHAILKRAIQRAPRASLAYLSMELRFNQLLRSAIHEPLVFKQMEAEWKNMGTYQGFLKAVQSLLGVQGRSLHSLKEADLAKLLYRDNLELKHSLPNHIQRAIAEVENLGPVVSVNAKQPNKTDVLAACILDFLMEAWPATCSQWTILCFCFSWNWSLMFASLILEPANTWFNNTFMGRTKPAFFTLHLNAHM